MGRNSSTFPYAVSPDGQRFLMPQPVVGDKEGETPTINVILNWPSLLKKWPSLVDHEYSDDESEYSC